MRQIFIYLDEPWVGIAGHDPRADDARLALKDHGGNPPLKGSTTYRHPRSVPQARRIGLLTAYSIEGTMHRAHRSAALMHSLYEDKRW
jgi:hypothetical protein